MNIQDLSSTSESPLNIRSTIHGHLLYYMNGRSLVSVHGGGVNNDPGATLIHILGGGGKKMSA